jgi:ribosomal protein S18 acetylase RimI-like enzyme
MLMTTSQMAWVQALIDDYFALGADVTDRCGSSFLRNLDAPSRRDANHVRRARHGAEDDIEAFLAAITDHYAGLPYRAVHTDWFTPPPLEARLLADGYHCVTNLVLGTDAPLLGAPPPCEVHTIPHDAPALAPLFEAEFETMWRDEWAMAQRRGDAYRWLVSIQDGRPAGHIAWRVRDGLGNLQSLYVLPDHRHRGLATALLHAATNEARQAGAGLVFLYTRADETTKDLYRRLGFEPMFPTRQYWRDA